MSNPEFKYQVSFENPNIQSDVPGEQNVRVITEHVQTNLTNVLGEHSTTDSTVSDDTNLISIEPSTGLNYLTTPVDVKNPEVPKAKEQRASEQETKAFWSEQNPEVSEDKEIAAQEDFVLTPVMTVTKEEAVFTKGDLKLQKISVTEDISVRFQHLFKKQKLPGKTVVTQLQAFEYKY